LRGQVAGTVLGLAGHDLEGRVPGQVNGIVVVFVALGIGEHPLPHQGQEIMFNLVGLAGITEAAGGLFSESVALVNLSQQQAPASEVIRPPAKSAMTSLEKRLSKMSWLWQTVSIVYPVYEADCMETTAS
jgi:hypothetical protein